jgi:hypothetical protein
MMGNVQDRTKVISLELYLVIHERKDKFPKSSTLFSSLAPLDNIIILQLLKDIPGCDFIAVYDRLAKS